MAWTRLLPDKVVANIATLGRLGYLGRAPGTLGSIAGVVFYLLFLWHLPNDLYLIIAGFLSYINIVICDEAEIRMQKHDPSEVIFDEFAAIPLCYVYMAQRCEGWVFIIMVLLGFGLFRFFDILKPLGIAKLQDLKGGLGVAADDIAAALVTCGLLHLILTFLPF